MSEFDFSAWDFVEKVFSDESIRGIHFEGPPGIGKTFAALHMGRCAGAVPLTLNDETSSTELRGFYMPNESAGMSWHDGPVTRAVRSGVRLVLNEVSCANGDVQEFLFPLLESPETAQVALPTGEILSVPDSFHAVLTDNFSADGLPAALRDRLCFIHADIPHPAALAKVREELRTMCVQAVQSKDENMRTGVRSWVQLTEFIGRGYSLREACQLAFGRERAAQFRDVIAMRGIE